MRMSPPEVMAQYWGSGCLQTERKHPRGPAMQKTEKEVSWGLEEGEKGHKTVVSLECDIQFFKGPY